MIRWSFLFVTLITSSSAFATIYIEPYVGYLEGTVKASETLSVSGVTVSGDVKQNEHGLLYGGKVGFSMLGFAVGADYMAGNPESGGDTSPLTDIGAFVGFSLPLLFKVSATYFISSSLKDVTQTDVNDVDHSVTCKGSGYKATIGFSFLPFVSINLDYIAHTWNKTTLEQGVTEFKVSDSGVMLGLSVPLDL